MMRAPFNQVFPAGASNPPKYAAQIFPRRLPTRIQAGFIGSVLLLSGNSGKSQEIITEPEKEAPFLEELWERATLYENPDAPYLQKLAFTGRLNYDYVNLDADVGEFEDLTARRFRLGFLAKFSDEWTLKSEAAFELNRADPFYLGLTDTYLQWNPTERFELRIGKQPAFFTLDGATSANRLLTTERNNLSRNVWFPRLYIPGALAKWQWEEWTFTTGLFSGGSASPEFGDFDGSAFGLFKVERDLSSALAIEEARVGFHYVYQDPDENNTFTQSHEQIASLNSSFQEGKLGLRTDLAASAGSDDQSDLFGLVIMPTYDLTERLQWVFRYTWVTSRDDNGVRLNLYERVIESGRGNDYQEFYTGLNYYLRGHQLKWQTGLQHVRMLDDARDGGAYDGWGLTSGIRISW